ncbi:RES family NAD+ phosphorylase [Pricia sp. S334]|uniref:RES family NAD+ phosphorylase n=1 Tax=Pricia mediterranea TaxID=3076079 RepID=A0ABU3L7N4_9FLAO|nr:RES family NAD+ phosphorylase [Pricia sp. S334]MDT7829077.1 RES family NAD+ phosphorylase [Pricia sp. S334]
MDLSIKELQKEWNSRPWPKSTQKIGTSWARAMRSVALRIPSARLNLSVYPEEHNLLINPLRPDFLTAVSIASTETFNLN